MVKDVSTWKDEKLHSLIPSIMRVGDGKNRDNGEGENGQILANTVKTVVGTKFEERDSRVSLPITSSAALVKSLNLRHYLFIICKVEMIIATSWCEN